MQNLKISSRISTNLTLKNVLVHSRILLCEMSIYNKYVHSSGRKIIVQQAIQMFTLIWKVEYADF